MKIGLLVEGNFDDVVFPIIIRKIIISYNKHISLEWESEIAHGPILPKLDEATKLFFHNEHACEFAVFHNDFDNEKHRQKKITLWVAKYLGANPSRKIVFVSPDPHFEKWFVTEEVALKHVLGLSSTLKLPYPSLEPKARVTKLIKEKNSIEKIEREYYEEIAERLDMDLLGSKDPIFKRFRKKLLEVIK